MTRSKAPTSASWSAPAWKSPRLILEGRYEWGFLRVNKAFADIEEIKTRSFTLLVGIRFN